MKDVIPSILIFIIIIIFALIVAEVIGYPIVHIQSMTESKIDMKWNLTLGILIFVLLSATAFTIFRKR